MPAILAVRTLMREMRGGCQRLSLLDDISDEDARCLVARALAIVDFGVFDGPRVPHLHRGGRPALDLKHQGASHKGTKLDPWMGMRPGLRAGWDLGEDQYGFSVLDTWNVHFLENGPFHGLLCRY